MVLVSRDMLTQAGYSRYEATGTVQTELKNSLAPRPSPTKKNPWKEILTSKSPMLNFETLKIYSEVVQIKCLRLHSAVRNTRIPRKYPKILAIFSSKIPQMGNFESKQSFALPRHALQIRRNPLSPVRWTLHPFWLIIT